MIKELVLTAIADMTNLFLSNKERCEGVAGEFGTYENLIIDFDKQRNRHPPNTNGGKMCVTQGKPYLYALPRIIIEEMGELSRRHASSAI